MTLKNLTFSQTGYITLGNLFKLSVCHLQNKVGIIAVVRRPFLELQDFVSNLLPSIFFVIPYRRTIEFSFQLTDFKFIV